MVDFCPLCLFKIGSLLILDNEVGHKCAPGINETNIERLLSSATTPDAASSKAEFHFPTLQVES